LTPAGAFVFVEPGPSAGGGPSVPAPTIRPCECQCCATFNKAAAADPFSRPTSKSVESAPSHSMLACCGRPVQPLHCCWHEAEAEAWFLKVNHIIISVAVGGGGAPANQHADFCLCQLPLTPKVQLATNCKQQTTTSTFWLHDIYFFFLPFLAPVPAWASDLARPGLRTWFVRVSSSMKSVTSFFKQSDNKECWRSEADG